MIQRNGLESEASQAIVTTERLAIPSEALLRPGVPELSHCVRNHVLVSAPHIPWKLLEHAEKVFTHFSFLCTVSAMPLKSEP